MENITLTGIDISKAVFAIRSENKEGRKVNTAMRRRDELMKHIGQIPKGSLVVMEACGAAHYFGKEFIKSGLKAELIAPQHVTPYRSKQKNDHNDAEAICRAARIEGLPRVSIKSDEQLDMQALHRIRERQVSEKTAIINQIRGLVYERGYVMAKSVAGFRKGMQELLSSEEQSTFMSIVRRLWAEFLEKESKVKESTKELETIAKENSACVKIKKIPGIGVMSSSALVAKIGNGTGYKNGRNFSASIGIVPRQFTTGGKPKLGRITKRGDSYLRQLLIHGARSAVRAAIKKKKTDALSLWIIRLHERCGANRTAVALANKNARVVWSILAGKTPVKHKQQSMAA
jgi:transposase